MAKLISGLILLRDEINQVNPRRDRTSDGWIGDVAHQLSASDHNPDSGGTVHAIDVDVDGIPAAKIVAFLVGRCRSGTERRLKYIIFRRTIWSASWGWTARAYKGANPHTKHVHFSAASGSGLYRGAGGWGIVERFAVTTPVVVSVAKPRPVMRHPAGSRRLELGSPRLKGADVVFVQRWVGAARAGAADGVYGPKVVAGVTWYQRMRGITADGVVGPQTWRQMGVRWSGG